MTASIVLNKQKKNEFWKTHYDRYSASGLSRAAYCRQENLRDVIFKYWYAKFKVMDNPTRKLIPVKVKVTASERSINDRPVVCTLQLSERFSILIHEESVLDQLIARWL